MKEVTELWKLIYDSNSGDKSATKELYIRFLPLLKKYSRKIDNEDALSELTVAFLEVIKKIPIQNELFRTSDKYILSYISTSIRNAYIQINSKKEDYINNNIFSDDIEDYRGICFFDMDLTFDEIKRILPNNDYRIIKMKYVDGYTEEEIAKMFDVSKQAISKRIKRAKKKLKENLY